MQLKQIFILGAFISYGAFADQVVDDDLIIQGNKCIGLDCNNGETFNLDILKLKENNLRIRLHDTSLESGLGQSWLLEANATNNNGQSYFDFIAQSSTKDSVQLSDGTTLAYDCSSPFDRTKTDNIGLLPAGKPVIKIEPVPGTCNPYPDYNFCEYTCSNVPYYSEASVLKMGNAKQPLFVEGTAIGYQSSMEDGAVSVGSETLLRRVVHIASALNSTDIVSLKNLNEFDVVAEQRQQGYELSDQLTALEEQTTELEILLTALELADIPNTLLDSLGEKPPRLPDGSVIDISRNGDMTSNSRWVNNIRLKVFAYTLKLAIEFQSSSPEVSCRLLNLNKNKLSGSRSWFAEGSNVTAGLQDSITQISTLYQCQ